MNQKVLIINYYYPPIVNGGVQRTFNFKKYLSQMGYEVSFLTTNSFGILKDDALQKVLRFPDKGYDYTHSEKHFKLLVFLFRAFRLLQVKTGILTDGKYYWKREVIKQLDYLMNAEKYDVVIASYPTPANLELGELIHRKYGIPLVVDYRDGLMYEPFYEVKKSFPLYKQRMISLEKRMSKIASLQLTVNPEMNQYYSEKYPNVKSVMIPNGFDDEEIVDEEPLELPAGINIIYTGGIAKSRIVYDFNVIARVLDTIFKASEKINFTFIGDYEEREKTLFSKYSNVYVHPKVERGVVLATQRKADAFLLISGPKGGTSGKLYEYMFAKKPILNIGSKVGIANIINGEDFGVTIEPTEDEAICSFLNKLETNTLVFRYPHLEKYTRRYQSKILSQEIRKIAKENG